MPTLFIHGIGTHDLTQFRDIFLRVRDRLRASLADRHVEPPPEPAFFPVYWGDWGPHAWYQGSSLEEESPAVAQPARLWLSAGAQAKAANFGEQRPFDPGLDALKTVLSAPGPLQEVLEDLGISQDELLHATAQTAGQQLRSAATVTRLVVRLRLSSAKHNGRLVAPREGWDALRALLRLILDQPHATPKALPPVMAYPFWATVTALARHMRGSIMQAATSYVGDVMMYLAHSAEVRKMVHAAIIQACTVRAGEPLVIIAHSLGGVIAYDYLTDPTFHDRPEVDLLVTAGSQVGLFAEYGLFQSARPASSRGTSRGQAARLPADLRGAWINLYDPDDFLSFPIGGVFPEAARGDRACPAGKPFPSSHSAYWDNDQVYAAIAEAYPTSGGGAQAATPAVPRAAH